MLYVGELYRLPKTQHSFVRSFSFCHVVVSVSISITTREKKCNEIASFLFFVTFEHEIRHTYSKKNKKTFHSQQSNIILRQLLQFNLQNKQNFLYVLYN
jgi:seryl-tRNA(Sec) selenium transferase